MFLCENYKKLLAARGVASRTPWPLTFGGFNPTVQVVPTPPLPILGCATGEDLCFALHLILVEKVH